MKNLIFYIENPSLQVTDRLPFFNGFDSKLQNRLTWDNGYGPWSIGLGPLDETGIEVCSTMQEIGNNKFYYPVILVMLHQVEETFAQLNIPDGVLSAIHSGNCKLLICSAFEGFAWSYINRVIDVIKQKYNLQDSDIITMTGNAEKNARCFNVYLNTWEYTSYELFRNMGFDLCKKYTVEKLKKYDFICLNRRPHPHRLPSVVELFPYRDRGLLSCASIVDGNDVKLQWATEHLKRQFPDLYQKWQGQRIYDMLPLRLPTDLDSCDPSVDNPVTDQEIDKFLLSKLHIVNETTTNYEPGNHLFLSEKIFKPIAFMQPFVLVGPAKSLRLLHSFGYQTFPGYIDESYDDELDENLRIRKALKAAIDFINQPNLDDVLISMLNILEHNQKQLLARISTIRFEAKNKLYDILHGE